MLCSIVTPIDHVFQYFSTLIELQIELALFEAEAGGFGGGEIWSVAQAKAALLQVSVCGWIKLRLLSFTLLQLAGII